VRVVALSLGLNLGLHSCRPVAAIAASQHASSYEQEDTELSVSLLETQTFSLRWVSVQARWQVLVFSQFTSMLDLMKYRLESNGLSCVKLEVRPPSQEEQTMVQQL
jgi:SNF2 family DNA or RNA helicase